jgi:hypothetical protein
MLNQEMPFPLIEIPEHSASPIVFPAIGLTEAIQQAGEHSGAVNPFDIGEALSRPASYYIRSAESAQPEQEDSGDAQ